jgi:hypothetical protein
MIRKIILPVESDNTERTQYAKHFAVSCEKQDCFWYKKIAVSTYFSGVTLNCFTEYMLQFKFLAQLHPHHTSVLLLKPHHLIKLILLKVYLQYASLL